MLTVKVSTHRSKESSVRQHQIWIPR